MSAQGAVIILDPKGDRELLVRSKAEAYKAGKPFALFSTAFREYSVKMNPLATATDSLEVAHRIQALMPMTKEAVFNEFPLALITRIAEAQQALGVPWTLTGMYRDSVFRRRMEDLIKRYLIHLGFYRPGGVLDVIAEYDKQGGNDLTADALIEDAKWPAEHYRKMTTSLIPTFRGIVGGKVGPLLSPPPGTGLTWEGIVKEGMVVYFALASMLIGDVANRIARIILQDCVGHIGYRFAYQDPATMRPLHLIVDDAGDVLYPQFLDVLNKGRGGNLRITLAMQSRADPDATLGDATARRIYDNLGTRLICGLADEQTAMDLTRSLTCAVELPGSTRAGIGYGGLGGLTGTAGQDQKHEMLPLIKPSWLTALPIGEAFARVAGIWWKLRLPQLHPVSKALRDHLGLTAMWDTLDPHKVYEGELCDTPLVPSVPPSSWLSPPVPLSLPSPAVMRLEGKSSNTPLPTWSQGLRRVWACVCAMVRRRVRPS